ncbi:MAG TPA: HD domain-containing phosphohydrolase [Acidimicrobiia bacterium]
MTVNVGAHQGGVRRCELVAALSLATDLGLGVPQEHVLRQTLIASRLAQRAGFSEAEQAAVYYASLLAWVGCIADSSEMAGWFGDDRALRVDSYDVDKAGLPLMSFMLRHVAAGASPLRRLTTIGRFLAGGFREAERSLLTHCQTAGVLAERLHLDEPVQVALGQAFERWDGKGVPGQAAGDQIDPVMRVVQIADDAEVVSRVAGVDAAIEMLRARSGTEFDPALVDCAVTHAPEVLGEAADPGDDAWGEVQRAMEAREVPLVGAELTAMLSAFADYADLKSGPWAGHSRGVAELAVATARALQLGEADCVLVERAALVHDIGVLGVSSSIWDRRTPWTAADRERVRTHPYLTERVLARPEDLAAIGSVAALHHERLDGSGYPHGVRAGAIPVTARIVAVADVLYALGETRVHRDAYPLAQRQAIVRDAARAGLLDADVVHAALGAAGHRVGRRADLPAGLTAREVDVLRHLVRGATNKDIARELEISPRTVGSHVEHIYTKIGVSTRGAAALYAMQQGLVDA